MLCTTKAIVVPTVYGMPSLSLILGIPPPGAQVQVSEGGRRGMRVRVTLPEAGRASVPVVEQALAAYLFEAQVVIG